MKASYDSIQGRIAVEWRKVAGKFELDIETPVPARVILPDGLHQVDKGSHRFEVKR